MNTQQIDSLLKRDPFSKKIFKKVCALDQIEQPTSPSAYVINSDPSNKPGEHWVAVYFDKNGKGEYFDSYGLPPSFLDLDEYMNRIRAVGFGTEKPYKRYSPLLAVIIVYIIFYYVVVVYLCLILLKVSRLI